MDLIQSLLPSRDFNGLVLHLDGGQLCVVLHHGGLRNWWRSVADCNPGGPDAPCGSYPCTRGGPVWIQRDTRNDAVSKNQLARADPGVSCGVDPRRGLRRCCCCGSSPGVVQAGVGLFIIWTVFASPPAWLRKWPVVTGGISSFLTMFFGATGVFVAGYTKAAAARAPCLCRHPCVPHDTQHLLKIVVFGILGFAFGPWLLVIIGMILFGVAGTLAGRLVLDRMSELNFKRILDAILVLIALRLIWAGLFGGGNG